MNLTREEVFSIDELMNLLQDDSISLEEISETWPNSFAPYQLEHMKRQVQTGLMKFKGFF